MLYGGIALGIEGTSGGIEGGGSGIDEVNHTVGGNTFKFLSGHTLHGLGTPVGTYIGEHLCLLREQVHEEHGHTVEGIVLSGYDDGLAAAVPVETGVEQGFAEVTVGLPVGPLALTLETAGNGVVAQRFLGESHFAEAGIALHQVAHDEVHLRHEFPILVLFLAGLLLFGAVLVPPFVHLAVGIHPCLGLDVFFLVVDAFVHAAQDFGLIHLLVAHAKVFLEEVGVDNAAGNTHRHASERKVTLAAHIGHRHGGTCPAENLLCHIGGNGVVVKVLHIMTVDAECGESLLGMCGKDGGKVYGSRTLRTVETPHGLRPMGIHVHGLAAIAPARGDSDGGSHTLALELFLAGSGFCHAADGAVGYDTLHGAAVAVAEIGADEVSHCLGQGHRLFFKTFANASLTAVNGWTDTNLWIFHIFLNFIKREYKVNLLHVFFIYRGLAFHAFFILQPISSSLHLCANLTF